MYYVIDPYSQNNIIRKFNTAQKQFDHAKIESEQKQFGTKKEAIAYLSKTAVKHHEYDVPHDWVKYVMPVSKSRVTNFDMHNKLLVSAGKSTHVYVADGDTVVHQETLDTPLSAFRASDHEVISAFTRDEETLVTGITATSRNNDIMKCDVEIYRGGNSYLPHAAKIEHLHSFFNVIELEKEFEVPGAIAHLILTFDSLDESIHDDLVLRHCAQVVAEYFETTVEEDKNPSVKTVGKYLVIVESGQITIVLEAVYENIRVITKELKNAR